MVAHQILKLMREFLNVIQDLLYAIRDIHRVFTENTFEYCISAHLNGLNFNDIFQS